MSEHAHEWQSFHADYCHKYENGKVCDCGEKELSETALRDFSDVNSAWWHWGRADCIHCEELMRQAGLDPAALGDEDLACWEMQRQFDGVEA